MKPSPLLNATVPRAALLANLETCSLVKPLLTGGALIEAREDSIRITADNLAILCRVEVPATVERAGSVVLSAARLLKLLDNADGDEVRISAEDEKSIAVKCGAVSSTLACGSVSDFPQRPVEPVQATFEVPNLRGALEWLSPVLNDDGREKGIHFAGDGRQLRVQALDSRQLHCVTIESSPTVANAIAPASLAKLAKAFEPGGACTVEITERTISIRGETFIQAQLLEGQFPDTARIIPAVSARLISLPKAALVNALAAAGAVLEKNVGPRHVNVCVKPIATTIAAGAAAGSVETTIAATNSIEIGFQVDPLRLLNAIKLVDTETVEIQCDDPLRSVCIRHGDSLALIATMHVP